jgi:hypothetical protein
MKVPTQPSMTVFFTVNLTHVVQGIAKTVTENWVIEAPSVGTILAYLETTA